MRLLRFIYAVVRDAIAGNLPLRAMGLVYVTILSIVPLLAISFSVLKGFGFHRQLEPLLYELLTPLGDRGIELTNDVIGFVENIKGDVLAGIGLVLLFVTTISMAQKVEDSFNFIWRVEHSRNLAQRLSEYLSVILVGPVVMVTALALLASIGNLEVVQELGGFRAIGNTMLLIGKLSPYLLVIGGFSFVYWFLPNTRVKLRAALVGGLAGGILWAAAGAAFTTFVAESARTLTIYATFSIVLIAMIWLYLCWLILLVGAQVAFYIQHPEYLRLGYRPVSIGNRQREDIALSVMGIVADAFRRGADHPKLADVSETLALPAVTMLPTIKRLAGAGLLVRTDRDELVPGRDPAEIRLTDVIAATREPLRLDLFPEGRWPDSVSRVSRSMQDALIRDLGDKSVYDLAPVEPPVAGQA
jgi:membrane protein